MGKYRVELSCKAFYTTRVEAEDYGEAQVKAMERGTKGLKSHSDFLKVVSIFVEEE